MDVTNVNKAASKQFSEYYGAFKSVFDDNARNVKRLCKQAMRIEALADKYKSMANEDLQNQTAILKQRLADGEKLDDIMYDAYAVVREAATRVLNMRHFFVQLMGGIALHQGRIAEMGTGEGKTLVATLPSYLNALTGEGVHVVTVNEYLAARDAAWMGKVLRFLGVSVGVVVPNMSNDDKRAAYLCDVTYCTNNELGFDFLRDNMCVRKSDKVQRKLNFAIVDEVDSILIDEARTPLIISGRGGKSSEMYLKADAFARTLSETADFTIEEKEKTIMLTDDGVAKAERYFKIDNLTDLENTDLYHYVQQALKAHNMMKKDRDYIVSDGEILIVDEFTGRVMIGRRYSDGLHQAIEAKEHVQIKNENKTLATITFQNFFRMYAKLSGMTGTAKTEEEEFRGIYSLDVVTIPPNKPSKRKDETDVIYKTAQGKFDAIVTEIEERHKTGQPVLVGTVSVEKSEQLSDLLKRKRIVHNVLNAKNHKMEAEIIAQAGRVGAVTIATNMAGRGTDIMLGGNPDFQAKQRMENDGVKSEIIEAATSYIASNDAEVLAAKDTYNRLYEKFKTECDKEKDEVTSLGGLRIIGTERHESRRIDNQLRGRSGRQGDPGSTVFYISCDDDVARIFGGERLKPMLEALHLPDDQPIVSRAVSKTIENAQKKVEGRNYGIRKQVLSYDDVMNAQRELIYKERGKVLDGLDVHEQIVDMFGELAEEIIGFYADYKMDYNTWDYEAFNAALETRMLDKDTNLMNPELCSCYDVYKLKEEVLKKADEEYTKKIEDTKKTILEIVGNLEVEGKQVVPDRAWYEGLRDNGTFDFGELERLVLLKSVDAKWMEHIDAMDALRHGIGLRGYGQRDPIISYRQEGWDMFNDMVESIHSETAQTMLKLNVINCATTFLGMHGTRITIQREERRAPSADHKHAQTGKSGNDGKVGRNDPCPCGSGLKFKNCKCKQYHPELYK